MELAEEGRKLRMTTKSWGASELFSRIHLIYLSLSSIKIHNSKTLFGKIYCTLSIYSEMRAEIIRALCCIYFHKRLYSYTNNFIIASCLLSVSFHHQFIILFSTIIEITVLVHTGIKKGTQKNVRCQFLPCDRNDNLLYKSRVLCE